MKATRGVGDDTFVLSLLCAIACPLGRQSGWKRAMFVSASTRSSVGFLASHARRECPGPRMAAAGGWSAHSFVGCPPVARCGLGGGGDRQGPRDGPGRLRAIETAGPPRPQAGWSRGSAHRNHGEEVPKRGLALTPAAGHGRGTGLGGIAGSSLDAIGDAHVPGPL